MKNKVLIGLCACVLFVTPLVSSAYFTDSDIIQELQSQIASLLKQVAELQAKIAKVQGQQTTGWCHTFNTDLRVGDRGSEVAALQSALAKEGFSIPDNETPQKDGDTSYNNRFMEGTASAVSAFQEKYRSEILTPAGLKFPTGYLGSRTRAKLNSLYGCGLVENQNPVYRWVIDSSTNTCQKKQFYDAVLYTANSGVKTFDSEAVCKIGLSSTDIQLPVITGPSSNFSQAVVGQYYSATFTVSPKYKNSTEIVYGSWQVDSIAPGLSAKVNSPGTNSYTLYGTPTQAGTYIMTVKVKSVDGNYSASQNFTLTVSSSAASAPSVSVTSPNGGEQWRTGESREIKWQSTNAPAGSWVGRVALYKNNGAVFLIDLVPFLSQSSANGSTYYKVPLNSVTGDDFKIQVILYSGTPGNESAVASDWSDTFSIASSPSSVNVITTGLCSRISQAWGETFVDVDAGSIYMGGKNYVVNGSTGVTAGANKTVNFYAYVPSGQSTGYIGVADPGTQEASNFESMGVLIATVRSGANPTNSISSYGGVIQNIESSLAKCPSYTRPVSTLNDDEDYAH